LGLDKEMKEMNLTRGDLIIHIWNKIMNKDYRYIWEGRKWPSGDFKRGEK